MSFIGDGVVQLADAGAAMRGRTSGRRIAVRLSRSGECGGWPDSPVVTNEKFSMASMGTLTPGMAETPPWLTAGMFHHRSLLSVPSICQFTALVLVPFTLA